MIANKVRGVFAAVCQDPFCAELARSHSDTNEKYRRRVKKVAAIDARGLRDLADVDARTAAVTSGP